MGRSSRWTTARRGVVPPPRAPSTRGQRSQSTAGCSRHTMRRIAQRRRGAPTPRAWPWGPSDRQTPNRALRARATPVATATQPGRSSACVTPRAHATSTAASTTPRRASPWRCARRVASLVAGSPATPAMTAPHQTAPRRRRSAERPRQLLPYLSREEVTATATRGAPTSLRTTTVRAPAARTSSGAAPGGCATSSAWTLGRRHRRCTCL
mmetsp:Transcript_93115/g.279345  ORF Transcript_93115/g.279345 Transcript_93115/m.279345 type:complete len:210 (-) Transcript_93115:466-1095(-)